MRQHGFIALPLMAWGAIAAGVLILGLSVAVKVQTARLDSEKAAFSAFKAQVEVLGREAEKAAKIKETSDLQAKKRADDENLKAKRDLAGVYTVYRQLRDSRSSVSILPPSPAGSTSPDLACFSRAALDRGLASADGVLQEGAIQILQRGDQAIADLNTAKTWSQTK